MICFDLTIEIKGKMKILKITYQCFVCYKCYQIERIFFMRPGNTGCSAVIESATHSAYEKAGHFISSADLHIFFSGR